MANKDFKKATKPKAGALIKACERNNLAKVKDILERGADINEKNSSGNTALILASINGYTDTARMLIEKGIRLDEKNNFGFTALIWSSANGHEDIAQMLIDKGATLDEKIDGGNTALILVCCYCYTEIARMLIDAGANLDEKDNDGRTALDNARENGHDVIVIMLEQAIKAKQEERQRILAQVCDPALQRPLAVKPPPKLGGRS